MIRSRQCVALAMSSLVAGEAQAQCAVGSDAGAVVRRLNLSVKEDADLIVAMTVLPKILHIDYAAATKRSGCEVGPVAGDGGYTLWSDDTTGRQRKALPTAKGAPVALIVPVIDIVKALAGADAHKTAQVEGYLLALVARNDEFTAVRYYTGMPAPDVLTHDMADALAGRAGGIFRQRGNKIDLIAPAP